MNLIRPVTLLILLPQYTATFRKVFFEYASFFGLQHISTYRTCQRFILVLEILRLDYKLNSTMLLNIRYTNTCILHCHSTRPCISNNKLARAPHRTRVSSKSCNYKVPT